jgi:hypothetical protein
MILRDLLAVQKKNIRPALDILYSHGLIRIRKSEGVDSKHNIYAVLGIGVQ